MNHGSVVGNWCGVNNGCGRGNRVYKTILVVIFRKTFKADGPKASFGSDQISKPGVHGSCCGSGCQIGIKWATMGHGQES